MDYPNGLHLGTIHMGRCVLVCDTESGQQQTSLPATIQGTITSAPVAESGAVVAQYVTSALDGSKDLSSLDVVSLASGDSGSFTTAAGTCPANAPFCSSYSFTLPSQQPILPAPSGTQQKFGPPGYLIYAQIAAPQSCTPPFAIADLQTLPGAQLTATDLAFTLCD